MTTVSPGNRPALAAADLREFVVRLRSLASVSADRAERDRIAAQFLGAFSRRSASFVLTGEAKDEPDVFDAVLFNGEWDLLAYRIDALSGVTSRTLVVEANRTFSGKPREYALTEAEIARRGWSGRVAALQVELPGWLDDAGIATMLQRDRLADLVARFASDGDFVLLCDIDEIPYADAVGGGLSGLQVLGMRQTLFFSNHERLAGPSRLHFGPALVPATELSRRTPSEIRIDACRPPVHGWEVKPNAGIHLQYVAPGSTLDTHLRSLGHSSSAIEALLRDRDRVGAGNPLSGYVCLTPERPYPGELAPIDGTRLAEALEYVVAASDRKSGRRTAQVPEYVGSASSR
ncbi:hypothetical protein GCM10017083_23040 [Thalassobaculum fulvum]|uniref:Glycosyltransferase family 17 n=1 Tax=Thalassobaculum fulvum TaxID=1633335 RepID=A0A918XSN2_9PROT|nr:hypothetical protein [Thalassobaculum fulvum]GHD49978.1 hypothetical protein GCM10017083_23040 [Thalassobaculum fulvum]